MEESKNNGVWTILVNNNPFFLSYSVTGRSSGSYVYRVKSCPFSRPTCSAYRTSSPVIVFIPPGVPPSLILTSDGVNGGYAVSWGVSSGSVDGYDLEQRVLGGAWESIYRASGRSKTVNLSDGDYDFRVRAYSGAVYSGYSSIYHLTVLTERDYAAVFSGTVADASVISPTVPANQSVGALQGQAGVSGGAASYAIPIALPPGRAGMQPSVSLNYSSRGGNGLAGMGWGLSAGSSISRCAATLAQDEYVHSPMYNAVKDRLCLNGQKLIAVNGSYGSNSTEYRTEMDSFAKITQEGGGINSAATKFKVEYKDGSISYFGYTADSKIIPTGAPATFSWLITKQHDSVGKESSAKNVIHYRYYSNFGDGENLLETIEYTGEWDAPGDRRVEFAYQARDDVSTTWIAGGKTRSTQRLKTIKTYYQTTNIRTYTLDYNISQATGRSLLASVEECGFNNNCLPATTFDWQDDPITYVLERVSLGVGAFANSREIEAFLPYRDVNRDGVSDWPGYFTNAEGQVTGTHSSEGANCPSFSPMHQNCLTSDFNQDGIGDVWKVENNRLWIGYVADDKTGNVSNWVNTQISVEDDSSDYQYVKQFTDFNGDGWPDIIIDHHHSVSDWEVKVYLHQRDLTSPYLTTGLTIFNYGRTKVGLEPYFSTNTPEFVGDIDGNGLADVIKSRTYGQISGSPYSSPYGVELVQDNGGSVSIQNHDISFSSLGGSNNEYYSMFIDINGDGLSDWLSVEDSSQGNYFSLRINQGNLQFSAPQTLVGAGQVPIVQYISNGEGHSNPKYMASFRVMDINGDGRNELLVPGRRLQESCTNYGIPGTNIVENLCGDELYGTYIPGNEVGDDVLPFPGAALDNGIYEFEVIYFDESSNGVITARKETPCLDPLNKQCLIGSATETAVTDAFGDGLNDLLFTYGVKPGGSGGFGNNPATGKMAPHEGNYGGYINRNKGSAAGSRYAPSDMMKSVTNGLQQVDRWKYQPLSTGKTVAGLDFYQTNAYVFENSSVDERHFYFASSMYVVSAFEQSNGLGSATNKTTYAYRGAVYNAEGRGFQGFRTILVDNPGGIRSATDFHQIFPYAGNLEQVRTCLVIDTGDDCINNPISVTSAIYEDKLTAGSLSSNQVHWIIPTSSVKETYALNNRSALLSKQTTVININDTDDYGNIKKSITTIDSGSVANGFSVVETITINDYTIDENTWWINKLNTSTVTQKTISGSALYDAALDPMKQIETKYTWTVNRQPDVVTVTPKLGGGQVVSVDTDYELEDGTSYGLPTSVKTIADGQTREVTMKYSSDNYFVNSVTNDLNHTVTNITDAAHGQVIQLTDANDLVTTTEFDAFGRVEKITPPIGQPAYSRFAECDGGCDGITNNNIQYKVTTYQAGSPETTLYKDAFNRVLVAKTEGFVGSDIYVTTEFDYLGRTIFTSIPSFSSLESSGTHFNDFDELNRLTEKVIDQAMNHQMTVTYSYVGAKTDIHAETSADTRDMSRTYSGSGQLMKTTDSLNGVTEYAYDNLGNPIVLQDANGNPIEAKYNALGQKTQVDDPNMGVKTFSYTTHSQNAASGYVYHQAVAMDARLQLIEATKANGILTETSEYAPETGQMLSVHTDIKWQPTAQW